MRARLSILALYNEDDTIFDGMAVPTGVDRSQLVDQIIYKCSDFSVIDASPDWMARMVAIWSHSRVAAWQRMADALADEYNALHNFDRTETWSDSRDRTSTSEQLRAGEQITEQLVSGERTDEQITPGSNVMDRSVAGYNQTDSTSTLVPESRESTGIDGGKTKSTVNSGKSKITDDGGKAETVEEELATHTGRMYGNIGVTTSQQMLESEIDLRSRYDIYGLITAEFRREFCVQIY